MRDGGVEEGVSYSKDDCVKEVAGEVVGVWIHTLSG